MPYFARPTDRGTRVIGVGRHISQWFRFRGRYGASSLALGPRRTSRVYVAGNVR